MPAHSIVDTPSGSTPVDTGPPGYAWDWTATTHEPENGREAEKGSNNRARLIDSLLDSMGSSVVHPGKGLQGWSRSLVSYDAEGYRLGAVYFGGGRDDVHVVSSSERAHLTRQSVTAIGGARTARVDTRVDTRVPFLELAGLLEHVAGPRTKVLDVRGRTGGESTGRTLYIGAPTSMVRVRLYEKWLESPGKYEDGVNRVEVQLRPPSRAKGFVSGWSPADTFCASKLTRRIAEELGTDVTNPETLQKSKGTPDLEKSLEAMGDQYGNVVRKWLEHSAGDWGRVLEHLLDAE